MGDDASRLRRHWFYGVSPTQGRCHRSLIPNRAKYRTRTVPWAGLFSCSGPRAECCPAPLHRIAIWRPISVRKSLLGTEQRGIEGPCWFSPQPLPESIRYLWSRVIDIIRRNVESGAGTRSRRSSLSNPPSESERPPSGGFFVPRSWHLTKRSSLQMIYRAKIMVVAFVSRTAHRAR